MAAAACDGVRARVSVRATACMDFLRLICIVSDAHLALSILLFPTHRYLTNQPSGWRALFRGVLPNVIQAIPGGAVSMLAFEFTLAALGPSTVRPASERLKAIKDKVTGMRDFTVYV